MDRNKQKGVRRIRRKKHIRKKLFGTAERPRLTVTRSHKNIHCQAIDDYAGRTLAAASTCSSELREKIAGKTGNCEGAQLVGELFAQKAKEAGVARLAFDRNGYMYHGRVKALAEAIRKQGIEF